MVTGGGAIGLLTAVAAKAFGAIPVVVSDVVAERRKSALAFGMDATLNPSDKNSMQQVSELTGDGFNMVFEASGARPALRQAFDLVRPGGKIIQIGSLGNEDVSLPANMLMVKEIEFIGSFRYGNIFDEAIRLVASGRIDLTSFITDVLPLEEISKAMYLGADKVNSLKVQVQI